MEASAADVFSLANFTDILAMGRWYVSTMSLESAAEVFSLVICRGVLAVRERYIFTMGVQV